MSSTPSIPYFDLQWTATNFSELGKRDNYFFYALSETDVLTGQQTLLYIGMTYRQSIKERLNNANHKMREYSGRLDAIIVWTATIEQTSYGRLLKRMVQDVECLLIRTHQPKDNGRPCRVNYTGRQPISVRSRFCPLIGSVRAQDDRFYDAQNRRFYPQRPL